MNPKAEAAFNAIAETIIAQIEDLQANGGGNWEMP